MNGRLTSLAIAVVAALVCATAPLADTLPPANTGHFYVSSFAADEVVVYDGSGAWLTSFTADGLNGPRGIVITPDGIHVASQLTNEVFVFDRDHAHVDTWSSPMLDGPTGMARRGDELFVASFGNDQVVVFDMTTGLADRSFTGGGMNGPNCVAFDSAGDIYVASALTANVLKFGADEQFQFDFTGGGLSSPMGIARNGIDDVLYVAGGGSNNIVLFTTDGTYLDTMSHVDLAAPQGVAFDDRGHLFSSSFSLHRIVEFDAGGDYVQTITAGNLATPRSVAFAPLPLGDIDDDGIVDISDLLALLGTWGPCSAPCAADLDDDGLVGVNDLLVLLGAWT